MSNKSKEKPEFRGLLGWVAAWGMALFGGRRGKEVADVADVKPGDRVLDVGCGPGNAVREAATRQATAVGLDPSPVMLRLAQRLTRPEEHPGASFVEGSVEHMPFEDGSFTIAWSLASAHHWDDIPAGLAELRRVLAPGGQLLIAETLVQPRFGRVSEHGFTHERAEAVAEQARMAGFEPSIERYRVGRRDVVVVVRGRVADITH